MIRKFILIFILLFLASCGSPQDYSQTYIIVMNRKKIGTEVVNEKTDRNGNRTCIAEQALDSGPNAKDKKQRIIKTKMVIPKGQLFPSSYAYDSDTDSSYEIKVEDGKIINTNKTQEESEVKQIPFDPGMPMLSLTSYHTIDYWIRKYDEKKRGDQNIQTYLFPSASIVKIMVTPSNTILPDHDNKELKIKNYEIEVDNEINILLWVDQDNRLYRMFIQGPNIEVIREDLFLKIEKDYKQQGENL